MLKLLKKFIFRKNTNKPVLLGRWNYSKQNLKNIYANYDHCGPCGKIVLKTENK